MNVKFKLPKEGGLIEDATSRGIANQLEKIPTSIFENEYDGVQYVADMVVEMINRHNGLFLLGLSTGSTPIGLYRELAARHKAGEVSFAGVAVYSLDEYYPISSHEQQSRNWRIHEDFLHHIDIKPGNIHMFDATMPQDRISEYCSSLERNIERLDLMILGMGEKGQIGFNEPGGYMRSRTRPVQLSHALRKQAAPVFQGYENVPRLAVTMGLGTIMKAEKIILMAWGENKADIVAKIVEGEVTPMAPASMLQEHGNIGLVIDGSAAEQLTRMKIPWLVGPCCWTNKFMRKAVVWLCGVVDKPILKLTYQDYVENSLGQLLDARGPYDMINIRVFNDLQHTISGWPGGKPNADDTTRPVPAAPFPKRVVIFSPHPDDDVISMGGTFLRLVDQGHDVHVAYETSGNFAVNDEVVLQIMDTARRCGLGDRFDYAKALIASKVKGEPEPRELLDLKGAVRRAEATAACRLYGVKDDNIHFLNLPFYETGGIKKGRLSQNDIDIVAGLLHDVRPHQIYAAGDLADPHGTHRICLEAVMEALHRLGDEAWMADCHVWLYRGAWQEWNLGMVDMAVPLSPEEVIKKRHAIYRHLSQKDIVPFPGDDTREFWQRAEERTQNTARLYDSLGMAEYQAIEVFYRYK